MSGRVKPHFVEAHIARIAARQHGIVSVRDLRQLGVSKFGVRHRIERGLLHRVHYGAWAVGYRTLTNERRWMAAVCASGPAAALSHESAARLWGVWRGSERATHVTTTRSKRGVRGVATHRSRRFAQADMTTRHGVQVTTLERTLVDLAARLTPLQLANIMHEAEFHGLFDLVRLADAIERLRCGRRIRPLIAALNEHLSGSAGTRSSLEDRFEALVRRSGMPTPLVNHRVETGEGPIEVDFLWPHAGLVVEVDGPGHRRARTRREDHRRETALNAAGYEVLRITNTDLTGRCAQAIELVRKALARAP